MSRFPLVLAALALSGALAACGGGDDPKTTAEPTAKPTGKADNAAARTAQAYLDGYSKKDAKAICAVLASTVRSQLKQKGNCVRTVASTMKTTSPRILVDRAYRDGDSAYVTVKDSPRQVKVVLENGEWKVIDGG